MATRYSKDKYAHVKNLKNEPLSLITPGSKKRKLDEGKNEIPTLQSLFRTRSSPTPSLEMMTFSPPTTRSKGKAKVGKSVWDDPAITLGRAHNAITEDELKGFSSISSPELVLGESLRLTMDYLSSEEKVVVANSKVDFIKAESSQLRKNLIEATNQSTKAKEKGKKLKEALKIEKKLVIQKDEEVQAALLRTNEEREKVIAKFLESDRFSDMQFEKYFKGFKLLRRWMMKHHSHVADFANLDFEAIDTEILADEANEKDGKTIAKATEVVEGEGVATRGANDEAQTEVNRVKEIVNVP
nr:hypothetical protein CFP56_64428 [Quercus suber]